MIVAGSASGELAGRIGAALGEKLAAVEYKKFPDGEIYVRLLEKRIEGPAIVVQSLNYPQNDNLVELLFLLDLLRQRGVKKVACVIPYYAYARQDKAFLEGELRSAETVAKLLGFFGVDFVVTCDLHFNRKEGPFSLFGVPAHNITASKLLVEHAKKALGNDLVVVTPDFGSAEQAKAVGGTSLKKKRITSYEVEVEGEADVSGKNVLVLDDIITTGGTVLKAISLLKQRGARNVAVACTHAACVGDALERIRKTADLVIAADTIPSGVSQVSVAEKIAGVLEGWKAGKKGGSAGTKGRRGVKNE